MPMYRVTYQSMTAFYGPSFIEAEDEFTARQIFARRAAFEMPLVKAREVSPNEIRRALQAQD